MNKIMKILAIIVNSLYNKTFNEFNEFSNIS